jgi:hypothetical protein
VVTSEIERLVAAVREAEAAGATIGRTPEAVADNGVAPDPTPPPAGNYTLDDV